MTLFVPDALNPNTSPPCPAPILGYAGRRLQMHPRSLARPCSATPFLDVDHALDALPFVGTASDYPGVEAFFQRDRDQLIETIRSAHMVFLSPGGGLLIYQSGVPRRWRVIHARSGAHLGYFAARSLDDPRPWTRLSGGVGIDLTERAIRAYVDALEGLVDSRGVQIDWTNDLHNLGRQIRRWQDHDDLGELPAPEGRSRFGGLSGLDLGAVLHAIRLDPMREAASGKVFWAVDTIVGPSGRLRIRGRKAAGVVTYLRELDFQYNHGRRRPHRERDSRTGEDLRDDRTTGKVITLARLLAFGGEPHRAVALLRERATAIRSTDARRRDGLHSGALVLAAQMIGELFSPADTECERLRHAQCGQLIAEARSHRPEHSPPYRVWRVTETAHDIWTDTDGHEWYQLAVHEQTEDRHGTMRIRPSRANPITVDYDDHRWPHSLPDLGGEWVVLGPCEALPSTSQDVLLRASHAFDAFIDDDPTA